MITVEAIRGNFVESRHHAYAVVVNEHGQLVKEYGNSNLATSPRSSIKMLQALPLVESGAADFYKLLPQHITLACASHNGEDLQIKFIEEWMSTASIPETWFRCGPHMPIHLPTKDLWIKADRMPTSKVNNCSGKHLGMMTTSLFLKENPQDYWDYHQPRQTALRKLMTEITGYDHETAAWGIDGCGIPTYAVPLYNMAVGMSFLIKPNKVSKDLQLACERIMTVVKEYPYFLAGSDEFNTETIKQSEGKCLIKVGAEGMFCGVLPDKGLAFALKALDGSFRCAETATAWLLEELGGITNYQYPVIKNWAGEVVGSIRVLNEDQRS